LFSLLNRFFKNSTLSHNKNLPHVSKTLSIEHLSRIAEKENALFYKDFPLFYQDTTTIIDLFLFFPDRGICFGEEISWDIEDLENATIERYTKSHKKTPTTHLQTTASLIHRKLEDIHSFDTTVCVPFFWMSHLKEEEYDRLDSPFHTLLPKERLIFSDSTYESIRHKITTMIPRSDVPYSSLKIMGSLQSHLLLLPTEKEPLGLLLSDEQQLFLNTDYSDTITSLFGEHNSGKSTAIVRKALLMLLKHPKEKLLIITPSRIGSEILRHELISVAEYGALKIDLNSLLFFSPDESQKIEENGYFLSASAILVDDAHILEKGFIDTLIELRKNRWLLLSMHNEYRPIGNSAIIFYNQYQININYKKIPTSPDELIHTLLLELRFHLLVNSGDRVMVMFDYPIDLQNYKEAIDEYFNINSRIINKEFSLQYQNLDDLILTTVERSYGIHVPHVYYVVSDEQENYSYALSRASESATIISVSNEKGDENG
jgi:hypothetical protein